MGAKTREMMQKGHRLIQILPVESVCLRCGDRTELPGGGHVYIDLEPRWTLGNVRPLYVERRPECLTCRRLHRTSNRFISKDQAVPLIVSQTLERLTNDYGKYLKVVIALLFDHWPPSGRTFQWKG